MRGGRGREEAAGRFRADFVRREARQNPGEVVLRANPEVFTRNSIEFHVWGMKT